MKLDRPNWFHRHSLFSQLFILKSEAKFLSLYLRVSNLSHFKLSRFEFSRQHRERQMKDYYHLPTPQKEHPLANRVTKSTAEQTRMPRKVRSIFSHSLCLPLLPIMLQSQRMYITSNLSFCLIYYLQINKKCLNSAFASVSEDVMLDSPNGLIDISSISEVSDDNQLCESAEVISYSICNSLDV